MVVAAKAWDGGIVRIWLEKRVVAARAEQVSAERGGRAQQDDCDKATAEEMVCTLLKGKPAVDDQQAFAGELRALLERDDYVWRGVYDDTRFDRHVRTFVRKLIRMAKTNDGFENVAHYQ
ncbi:hypothetical protein [Sphingomonas prati]|uniref:Uncharacterized protein n=1 Tax=Sphingomonas prati TaxID=1843237 RepID=A0A7W9BRB5_9SPHN|nr:hypothetical protein [Sphingomonas prati]MBB5728670.1 hypothetical protein [Sphingomonas prati]GGE72005.1 hypothetical protein GCM10011404_00580 [Sphingomonas prati]